MRTEELLSDLEALRGRRCAGCGGALCGHTALFSVMLGYKDAPRCLACLARGLDQPPERLRDHLLAHAGRRDCFRAGLSAASRAEGFPEGGRPACLFPSGG